MMEIEKEESVELKLEELERRIRILEDIEAIKRLKAKYWRCCDKKLWDELEECFTEDAIADYFPNLHFEGRDAIIKFLKESLGPDYMITAHGGHNAEIEIISETEARGIWALNDLVIIQPGIRMRGYGHYEDEYVKENGRWKIKRIKQTRIIEEWIMDRR
ncbi:MAG: nuclear transport factor 2 family protein [Candidatus Jordarchaeales archaeon]|nr:nuclear transport factor 2 family protein [Candidatus Jordarchaeia archaeon]